MGKVEEQSFWCSVLFQIIFAQNIPVRQMLVHTLVRTLPRHVRTYAAGAAPTRVLEAVYEQNGNPQSVIKYV